MCYPVVIGSRAKTSLKRRTRRILPGSIIVCGTVFQLVCQSISAMKHFRTFHALLDMETLSRMTGKDFSGPVPEIRTPTPLPNAEVDGSATGDGERSAPRPTPKRNNNRRKAADDGVVIIGEVGSIGDQ